MNVLENEDAARMFEEERSRPVGHYDNGFRDPWMKWKTFEASIAKCFLCCRQCHLQYDSRKPMPQIVLCHDVDVNGHRIRRVYPSVGSFVADGCHGAVPIKAAAPKRRGRPTKSG